jgi:hypothetical protein
MFIVGSDGSVTIYKYLHKIVDLELKNLEEENENMKMVMPDIVKQEIIMEDNNDLIEEEVDRN